MSQFTKGPWFAEIDHPRKKDAMCIVIIPTGETAADFTRSGADYKQSAANARLAAAAPELLAALKNLVQFYAGSVSESAPQWAKAINAITKAES